MAPMSAAAADASEQRDSKLMQLPQEIRDQIYEHLFCSTRFASGERTTGRIESQRIVSAHRGKALSILRTCRRIHLEVGREWLHQVLFHFEDPEAMLQKLANISESLRGEIRHVRVSGQPLMLSFKEDDIHHRTAQVLKLLPGLKLDVLTILGDKQPDVSYQTLNMLIRHSNGWKELRYISHSSEFLGFKDELMLFLPSNHALAHLCYRQPQPFDWQSGLERRDGQASRPFVTIHRSKEANVPQAILLPESRVVFSQVSDAAQDRGEDAALMRRGEQEKEVSVIVRRGIDVDYCECESSPALPVGSILEAFDCKTWNEVKAVQDDLLKDMRDEDLFGEDDDDNQDGACVIDTYTHVDEYTWPPYHFVQDQYW